MGKFDNVGIIPTLSLFSEGKMQKGKQQNYTYMRCKVVRFNVQETLRLLDAPAATNLLHLYL